MSIAALIRRMAEAGATPEAIAIAVEAIEQAQSDALEKDAARRHAQAERKRRQRHGRNSDDLSNPCHGTVTGQSRDGDVTSPETKKVSPHPSKKTQTPTPVRDPKGSLTAPAGGDVRSAGSRQSIDVDFEAWWQGYPHKIGKAAALKAFRAALKSADLDTLTEGVQRYIRQKPADRAWCNPATWLNQQRWLDAPAEASAPPSQPPALPKGEALVLRNGKEVPRRTAVERCVRFFRELSETGRRNWSPISSWFDDKPPDDPGTVYPPEIVAEAREMAARQQRERATA